MNPLRLASITEQVAAHLREEIVRGALIGEMPGAKKLANQLGINHKTVDAAARILENQGYLLFQGAGIPRRIVKPRETRQASLCAAILTYEPEDALFHTIIELRHALTNAGHTCILAEKSQMELRFDIKRVARMVENTKVDAWIVQSGSREILEWFESQGIPFIAMHGRFIGLPVAAAGISMAPAIITAVDHLVALGHRRIVMFAQETDLIPTPGLMFRVFLEQLEKHGIQTSSYNHPRWECSPDGMHKSLDALLHLTPPTALFVSDVVLFFPTYLHLLRRGIRIPDDLSLICTEGHPQFNWCVPRISYFGWNSQALILRILEWANNMASGKEDLKQKLLDSEFIANETVGPGR